MPAIKQINAAFNRAASGSSPLGTGYTGPEIIAAIKAGKLDDGKLDAREKNLIARNLMYKGNGMDASGTREFKKAFATLGLPKRPLPDREWVRLNAILTSPAKPLPSGPLKADYSSPAKTILTLKRAAAAGNLTEFKKAFETRRGSSPGNLVGKWATQREMERVAADVKAGRPWEVAGTGKKYDGGKSIIDYLVTGRKPDPILQATFEQNARGEWKLAFVSDAPPSTPFGRQT